MEMKGMNDPKTLIIAAGMFLLIIVVGYSFFYKSTLAGKKSGLSEELAEKEEKLRNADQVASRLDDLKIDYERLQAELREAEQKLPREKEIPTLLKQVTTLSDQTRVHFISFTPKEVIVEEFYKKIPISLKVKCKYHDLAQFFVNLGKLPRIVNVSGVQIRTHTADESSYTVEADFDITAFTCLQ